MTYMKIFLLRNVYFVLGIIINALGIALITKQTWGHRPFPVFLTSCVCISRQPSGSLPLL